MNKGTPWSVSTRYLYEQATKHMFIPDIQDRDWLDQSLEVLSHVEKRVKLVLRLSGVSESPWKRWRRQR